MSNIEYVLKSIRNLFSYKINLILALFRFFRRKHSYSLLLYLITLVVILNELIIFSAYRLFWPYIACGYEKNYFKILLVADPQILGENTEFWIARWDSDRFLRNSFRTALEYTKPDVILFLGDLMDEGSKANAEEFSRYLSRFKWIFQQESIPTVFIPGDNDIGGEDEPVYFSNVERFEKSFGSKSDLERYKNLEFYKVNKILRIFPRVSSVNSSAIRIAVSHIPLLGYSDDSSVKVIKDLRPQLIFSAHDHKSLHFVGDLRTGETLFLELLEKNRFNNNMPSWRFQNGEIITNEITVPTCSYRMGAQNIGYGLALIDKKGSHSCYMILWLPQRLYQLFIYICSIIGIFMILFFPLLLKYCKYLIRRSRLFTSNSVSV